MDYASRLNDPQRTQRMLELIQVSIAARRPANPGRVAKEIEALAERALNFGCSDHARLGFHLLSLLSWEEGDWSDAERSTILAEQVSRTGSDREKMMAMAEAARCPAPRTEPDPVCQGLPFPGPQKDDLRLPGPGCGVRPQVQPPGGIAL